MHYVSYRSKGDGRINGQKVRRLVACKTVGDLTDARTRIKGSDADCVKVHVNGAGLELLNSFHIIFEGDHHADTNC